VFVKYGLLDIIGAWLEGIHTILFAKRVYLSKSAQFDIAVEYIYVCELPKFDKLLAIEETVLVSPKVFHLYELELRLLSKRTVRSDPKN
jgi:hypothetical protein